MTKRAKFAAAPLSVLITRMRRDQETLVHSMCCRLAAVSRAEGRWERFDLSLPSTYCATLACWRLVELYVIAFAVLESYDTSPGVLGDLGGEYHALLLEVAYRLI